MKRERPDCGPEVQWNLPIEDTTGNHLYICVRPASRSVPNSEVDQVPFVRTADSINGEVSSIHFSSIDCTVFRFILRFRFLYRLHCTHTPLSRIALSSLLAHLLLHSLYKLPTMLQSLVYTSTHTMTVG